MAGKIKREQGQTSMFETKVKLPAVMVRRTHGAYGEPVTAEVPVKGESTPVEIDDETKRLSEERERRLNRRGALAKLGTKEYADKDTS